LKSPCQGSSRQHHEKVQERNRITAKCNTASFTGLQTFI
jgi:hypothetical protein